MAKLSVLKGATSVLVRIFVQDSTSTTGAGKTGLINTSFTGTKVYVARDDDGNAGGTSVSLTAGTRGTWSSGGIVEKDSTNMPGVYEFGLTNASLVTGSRSAQYLFIGTGIVPCPVEIEITGWDNQDGVRGGMTALPNAAAGANAGLPVLSSSATTLAYTVSTVTTYTGNTVQTGDNFARIGALGAGLTALAPSATALSTATWTGTLATNLTTLASHDPGATIGTSTYAGGPVDSVTNNVGGNVTGSVASVSAPVTVGTYSVGQDPATLTLGALQADWVDASTIGLSIAIAAGLAPIAGQSFSFPMKLAADDSLAPSVSVTATRITDSAAPVACTNAVTEIGGGFYTITFSVADLTFTNDVMFIFAAALCKDTIFKQIAT